jgi:hypothetical protein
VNSARAHIYKKDWDDANKVIKAETKLRCIPDPRGNVVVTVDQEKGTIELSLLSPRGELTAQMSAKDSVEAMEKMTMADWISKLEHAMDLGKQLGWADLALQYGFDFRQDNMPKLEAVAGQAGAVKRTIRSGSGAAPGDVKKQNEDAPNVCGPDTCEPAGGTDATCGPNDGDGGGVCV